MLQLQEPHSYAPFDALSCSPSRFGSALLVMDVPSAERRAVVSIRVSVNAIPLVIPVDNGASFQVFATEGTLPFDQPTSKPPANRCHSPGGHDFDDARGWCARAVVSSSREKIATGDHGILLLCPHVFATSRSLTTTLNSGRLPRKDDQGQLAARCRLRSTNARSTSSRSKAYCALRHKGIRRRGSRRSSRPKA